MMIYYFISDLLDAFDKFIITMKMPQLIENDEVYE